MHFEAAVGGQEAHLLRKAHGHGRHRRAPLHGRRQEVRGTQADREIRRPAPLPDLVPGPVQARQERRDRRHRPHGRQLGGNAGAEFQQHQALPQQEARPQVGRHGMAAPQLVLLRVDLRRPDRGAAPAQHRRLQLVHGRASGGSGGLRRRRVASARGRIRQHLRPLLGRFRLRRRHPHVQLLPPVQRQRAERQRAHRRHQGRRSIQQAPRLP